MRGFANNQRRNLETADFFNRQIILAEMHTVSAGGYRDVGTVVYYRKNVLPPAYFHKFRRNIEKRVILDVFDTQLNAIRSAGGATVG